QIGRGRWDDAQRALDDAMAAFARIGDGRWRDMVVLTVGNLHYHHRRSGGVAFYRDAERAGRERGDLQTKAWSALGLAATRLTAGAVGEALEHLEAMDGALSQRMDAFADRASQLGAHGV